MSHSNYRLISLWDMLQLPIHRLIDSYQILVQLVQVMMNTEGKDGQKFVVVDDRDYKKLCDKADEFASLCLTASMSVTHESMGAVSDGMKLFRRTGDDWRVAGRNFEDLEHALNSMIACVQNEAKATVAMILPGEKVALFSPTSPLFGLEVSSKFPSTSYDIDEAGKCLALGRSTAGAFHAIRCLEAGITAMSRCLAIPDPTKGADRNWGSMLNKIKIEIDRRWVGAASRFSGDGEIFEGLYGVLAAMQNPYRNATMHFDQKYTEEEARHIFDMVSGVMRKIASRMDENGEPKVP